MSEPSVEPSLPPLRPRYGRLGAAGASVTIMVVALLGGIGVLPTSADSDTDSGASDAPVRAVRPAAADPSPTPTPTTSPAASPTTTPAPDPTDEPTAPEESADDTALPAQSGQGRRVVFSESAQRVWLVDADGSVLRTYLVSGSVYDNLDPGRYSVYSRSAQAWGIDDSGTMRLFVRFTRGDEGAAIGFHTIPVDNGKRVQSVAQLGTPTSHGCIRQATPDARALWDFAPLGTRVVVV